MLGLREGKACPVCRCVCIRGRADRMLRAGLFGRGPWTPRETDGTPRPKPWRARTSSSRTMRASAHAYAHAPRHPLHHPLHHPYPPLRARQFDVWRHTSLIIITLTSRSASKPPLGPPQPSCSSSSSSSPCSPSSSKTLLARSAQIGGLRRFPAQRKRGSFAPQWIRHTCRQAD